MLTLFTNISIEANSVGPDQTAPIVWSGSTLFAEEASETLQQMIKADDFFCDWHFKVKYFILHSSIIYEPTKPDNEEQSAELFKQFVQQSLTDRVSLQYIEPRHVISNNVVFWQV